MAGSSLQDAPLFGRDEHLELLRGFVDSSSFDGDALFVLGAPGVGKTVLLDVAAAYAADTSVRVLRASGGGV